METKQIQEEKTRNNNESVVFVGMKPFGNYTTAVVMQMTREGSQECTIKGRGKFVTRCVDVAQVVVKRLLQDKVEICDIKIDSESFNNKENREIRVSTIEIKIRRL